MKSSVSLLILLLLLIGNTSFAQKLSDYEKKLDRLLYNTNSYIVEFDGCLSGLYAIAAKGQKINKYSQSSCNHETPWDVAHIQDSAFYQSVAQSHPELFKSFNKLNEVCKQVVIDLKMERLDETKLSNHFERFEKSCQSLQLNSEALRSKWRKEALLLLPKELANYMEHNFQQFKDLQHYLRQDLAANFPEALLRKNLEDTDSLLVLLEVKSEQDSKLKLLMYSIQGCQQNKKYYLNELDFKNTQSAKYRNDFYYQIHNHYNNGLVQMLRTHYNTPYSLFIPIKPFHNQTAEKTKLPDVRFKTVHTETYEKPINHWNFKDADALGELTGTLNLAVRKTNQNTVALFKLQAEIEQRRTRGRGTVKLYHEFSLNLGDIEGALGRLKPGSGNQNEAFPLISTQVNNLMALLEDTKIIYQLIELQLDDEARKPDDFEAIEALVQQYRQLMQDFEAQLKVLEKNINKANSPKLMGQDNWSKTTRALEGYCQELRAEANAVEGKTLTESAANNYDYTKIEKAYQSLLEQEINMMSGIKKLGSSNGNCPYGTFEDVLDRGLEQHRKALRFQDSTHIPFSEGYARLIDVYNNALEYYNKFSRQGSERDSDYAKYYHKTPVVNALLLYKAVQLPAAKTILPPTPIPPPAPKKDTTVAPSPKKEATKMTKEYIQGCKPNNILFLIDISASMKSKEKLEHFKNDLVSIKALMRPEDKISIISFEGKCVIELKQSSILDQNKWEKVIDKLSSSGGTRFNEGLELAYDYMYKITDPKYNNRVVLISDGEFMVNDKSTALVQVAGQNHQIAFSALIYNSHAMLLEKILALTALTTGNYALITGKDDGAAVLFEEFSILKE